MDDLISRQAVVDSVNKALSEYMGESLLTYSSLILDYIKALPPVQPAQKVGKWIIVDDCEQFIAKCSECGRIEDSRMISKYPYCHCGAKMQEGDE